LEFAGVEWLMAQPARGAIREANLHASHALVIVDWQEQESKQKIEVQGVELMSLVSLEDLKAVQLDQGI